MTATSRAGERCGRPPSPGGSVCRFHGGAAPQVKAAAAARLRAMVDPALGVLEYAIKRKDKDLRGALAAAKEVLDRAKPEDGEESTEVRTNVNIRYFDGNLFRENAAAKVGL